MESILIARQQCNELVNHLFKTREEAEKLAVMMISAVGESPVNDAGRQALERAQQVHGELEPLVRYIEDAKFQLDEYAGTI